MYAQFVPKKNRLLNRAELARLNRWIDKSPNDTGCWLWKGKTTTNGYGKFSKGSGHTPRAVHRITYEHYNNLDIPEGMQLDHLCRHRNCCNPDHLEVVTPSENTMRQDHANRNKTHCPHGHEYTEENTAITSQGKRRCRMCDKVGRPKKEPKSDLTIVTG